MQSDSSWRGSTVTCITTAPRHSHLYSFAMSIVFVMRTDSPETYLPPPPPPIWVYIATYVSVFTGGGVGVILQLLCLYLPGRGVYCNPCVCIYGGGGGGILQLLHLYLPWGGGVYSNPCVCIYWEVYHNSNVCIYLRLGGGGVYCNQCVCMSTWYVAPGVV